MRYKVISYEITNNQLLLDPTPEVTFNMRLVVMKTVEYEEVT